MSSPSTSYAAVPHGVDAAIVKAQWRGVSQRPDLAGEDMMLANRCRSSTTWTTRVGGNVRSATVYTLRIATRCTSFEILRSKKHFTALRSATVCNKVAMILAAEAPHRFAEVFLKRVTSEAEYTPVWHGTIITELGDCTAFEAGLGVFIALRNADELSPNRNHFGIFQVL